MVFKLEGENTATLHFKAVVTKNAAVCSLGILENRIATSATELAEIQDASKLELLSMGGLTYRFVNRLDPLVYFKNYLREVVNWKNPLHTLFFGFFCTFFILNPRLALMIVAALIVWHKDTIFIKLENFSRHTKDRLVPPQ